MFFSPIQKLFARKSQPSRSRQTTRFRPQLEHLEERALLSATIYVNAADASAPTQDGTSGHPFGTIQQGVNAAATGDTVLVEPGTYNESVKITTQGLTLESADGASSTFLNGNSATENYYMVEINANNVTLEGFDISNPIYTGTADASGVVVGDITRVSGVKILDNVIHDMGPLNRSPASLGTYGINVGPSSGTEIAGNTIYNIGNGSNDPNSDAVGILTWGNDSSTTNASSYIHDNIIHNITSSVFASAISIGYESRDAVVSGNTITGVSLGITTSASMDEGGSTTIEDNSVTNGGTGLRLASPYTTNVTDNTISGNVDGVVLVSSTPAGNTHINNNNIVGNSHSGVTNDGTGTLDATYNWWGSSDGPAPGSIIGNVKYNPWLVTPADTPSTLFWHDGSGDALMVDTSTGNYAFFLADGQVFSGTHAAIHNGKLDIRSSREMGQIFIAKGPLDGEIKANLTGRGNQVFHLTPFTP